MFECASFSVRRNMYRFAITGFVGVWLSGCSSDSSRFADGGNPFTNPFSNSSNGAAPTPRVSGSPLASAGHANSTYAAAAHPSPVSVASLPTSSPETTGRIRAESAPVGGPATGWSAVGGTPVVVGQTDNIDTLSRRYGVPTSALLSTNGIRSASEISGGMHMIIPVYNAHGHAVVENEKPEHRKTAEADEDDRKSSKSKLHKSKDDSESADDSDGGKKHHKSAKLDKEDGKSGHESKGDREAKADREDKDQREAKSDHPKSEKRLEKTERSAKVEKSDLTEKTTKSEKLAKADASKTDHKKPTADMIQTGALPPSAPAKDETSKQADAAGASPEFRWPARGRIIQGFKTGGNEGINIAVPEGTSVRAAEDGKVAYAGSALKGYGNLVLIRHPNGFVTAYANNGELSVKSGETVKRGQVIAKSGQTGDVNSPQLHFELRKGQTPVDPTSYLAGL